MCIFVEAWCGKCNKPGEPFCENHNHLVCCVCGSSATHTCDATAGSFVCGAYLCDDCEHELDANVTNGFNFRHCRKKDQKYKPLYEQEVDNVQDAENKKTTAGWTATEFLTYLLRKKESKLKGRAATIRRLQKQVDDLTPHMVHDHCEICGLAIWSDEDFINDVVFAKQSKMYHGTCWINMRNDEHIAKLEAIIKERDALIDNLLKGSK